MLRNKLQSEQDLDVVSCGGYMVESEFSVRLCISL